MEFQDVAAMIAMFMYFLLGFFIGHYKGRKEAMEKWEAWRKSHGVH